MNLHAGLYQENDSLCGNPADRCDFVSIGSQSGKGVTDGLVTTRFMPYVVTGMIGICAAVDLLQTWSKEGA